jgi:hypothetical protein
MSDERFFERALERIARAAFAIAAGGAIAVTVWKGWAWGVGFAIGAVASWLNFRLLKQIVDALGRTRPVRKRLVAMAGLRYALLGGGAYVILHFSPVSVTAALIGLFVAVAAVIVEICFELAYARD